MGLRRPPVRRAWEALGATHLGFTTMRAGYKSVGEHIEAVRAFKEAMG